MLVGEIILYDLSVKLTQGHGCDIDYHQFACQHDKVRTTHPSTTKLDCFIPLVMIIT